MTLPRYPAYKDSGVEWLGEVPNHWSVMPLKRLVSLRSGEMINSSMIDETGDYPVFGGNGIRGFTSGFTHSGDFALVGRQGALCGNVNYAQGQFWASEHAIVVSPLRPTPTQWIGELLHAMNLNQYSTSAAQPGLSVDVIANLSIPVPSREEQQLIANFLHHETSKIDALIAEQQNLIALLKEKRQAVISHAVTKGMNPDAPMRDSGVEWLGEVPEHWEVSPIRRLVTEHRQGYYSTNPYVESGVKLLRITDLRDSGTVNYDSCPLVEDCREVEEFILRTGDFVFARTGGAGSFGLIDATSERVAYASYLIRFRFSTNALHRFMRFVFLSAAFKGGIQRDIHGGVNQNVHAEDIKNQYLALPSADDQNLIADFLETEIAKFDALTSEAQRAIDLLQERRSALISAAVTGKIDVRNLVRREAA